MKEKFNLDYRNSSIILFFSMLLLIITLTFIFANNSSINSGLIGELGMIGVLFFLPLMFIMIFVLGIGFIFSSTITLLLNVIALILSLYKTNLKRMRID